MQRDTIEHAAIAATVTLAIGLPLAIAKLSLSGWLLGACVAVALFYGREERDAENRAGKVVGPGNWRVLAPWRWTTDGKQDLIAPIVAAGVVALGGWILFGV